MLFAFVIILLVSLYTMSTFASGQRHYLRAQELSTATTLVHSQMEQLLAQPLAEVVPTNQGTLSQAPGYSYQLTLSPYQSPDGVYSDLTDLELTVRSPMGATASASALRGRETTPQDNCTDPNTNLVAVWDANQLRYWDDNAGSMTANLAETGEGSLAGSPGLGMLWAVNSTAGLSKWVESPTATSGTWKTIGSPSATSRLSGVACDGYGQQAFIGDSSKRCLWSYTDSTPPVWAELQPTTPALGSPSGVACDPYASVIWVADAENQCLRKFIVGSNPYPAGYAVADGAGYWLTVQYHPPASMGMGIPLAIRMDPYSYTVYVIDGARLYTFVDDPNPANIGQNKGQGGPGTWIVSNLDSRVIGAQPCGLTGDAFDNELFINCRGPAGTVPNAAQLWKYQPGLGYSLKWS